MKPLAKRLASRAPVPVLLCAAAVFITYVAALRWFDTRVNVLSGGAGKPDLLVFAEPRVILDTLTRYGAQGRAMYVWSTLADTGFAVSLAGLGALLLIRAWPQQRWMLWLPPAFCALDLVENAGLLVMVARFPAFSPTLGWFASIVTSAKLIALVSSYALMAAAVVRLMSAAWPRRHPPGPDPVGKNDTQPFLAPLVAVTAALCTVLAPVQSLIWNGPEAPGWMDGVPWSHTLITVAEQVGLGTPYFFYGRLFILVYVGVTATLWLLSRSRGWLTWPAMRWLLASLTMAAWGDLLAYWGGQRFGDPVRFVGFWLTEVPALVIVACAGTAFGVSLRYAGYRGSWLYSWLLLAPAMLFATAALQYMPHGPMLAVALACLALVFGAPRAARQVPQPTVTPTNPFPRSGD
ncbi:hypothetical protein [Nocardia gipuzkoensis]